MPQRLSMISLPMCSHKTKLCIWQKVENCRPHEAWTLIWNNGERSYLKI